MKTTALLALLLLVAPTLAQPESPAQRDARLQWWREARFGMFIHWGPVSLTGEEIGWSRNPGPNGYGGGKTPAAEYDALFKRWNPSEFNAKQWVAIAQAAGMKYMVFTSKHHDGFCEWDSKLTDYKITSPESPFHRDVVRELADACHAAGLRFGLYYSPPDAHHPDYHVDQARYNEYFHGQIRELLSNYGKLDIIWFDSLGGSAESWGAEQLFADIKRLQPDILINNRLGLPADYDTPEQTIGGFQLNRPWETCMTICNQWAWRPDDAMKPLEQCLRTLISCAGGDGNLLFNVGPMPTGAIEPRQVDRLKEMGDWLGKYGESVYATRGGPYKPNRNLASTRRGDTVYVHVFKWTGETLTLPALPAKVLESSLLTGGTVQVAETADGLALTVAKADQQAIDTIVKLKLDRPAMDIAALRTVPRNLVRPGMKVTASNVYLNMAEHGADRAIDGNDGTRWATDGGTRSAWLEVDLGHPTTFDRLEVDESYAGRVQKFELQVRDGEAWKACYQGTTIGESFVAKFDPVTAQVVRLNILEATEGPTIFEARLFSTASGTSLVNANTKLSASNVFQNEPTYAPEMATDDDTGTRWATDGGTKTAWLAFDFGRPVTLTRAEIDEAIEPRVQAFELQYKDGEAWKTFYTGATIGPDYAAEFAPVTAREVRLNILDATNGPTIWEVRLFGPAR
ncbi:MAG: alpha-L-fucosidase [Armatimonadetes bacterium]|nr:alpha-L-fucosidase [Armatimonadota bacterium]